MKHFPGWLLVGVLATAMSGFAQQRRGGGPGCGCPGCNCPAMAGQQAGARAPIASNPVVEIKGKIAKVQIARGQGMPSVEVEQNGGTVKVFLGSMRYLMQQDFNPKSGEEIAVKGYRVGDSITAITATLANERTLRLRDDSGWPVWAPGGRMGRCRCCGQ